MIFKRSLPAVGALITLLSVSVSVFGLGFGSRAVLAEDSAAPAGTADKSEPAAGDVSPAVPDAAVPDAAVPDAASQDSSAPDAAPSGATSEGAAPQNVTAPDIAAPDAKSQDAVAPADDAATPAASTAKTEEPSGDVAPVTREAPSTPAEAAPADNAASGGAANDNAASDNPATDNAAGNGASDTAASPAAAATAITASALAIGTAVFGADGAKIGEVNRVTTNAAGDVEEIQVTDGGAAGLNAKAFAVPADKITGVNDGVKLSLSAAEVKKLPLVDDDGKG